MVHFLMWLLRGDRQWHAMLMVYSWSHVALWLTTVAWSMISLVSIVLLWLGRSGGRVVYMWGAILWGMTTFMLAPWQLALSGVILPLSVLSILYGRDTRQYLKDGLALSHSIDTTTRGVIAAALWVSATAFYYAVFLMELTNKGWLAEVTNDPQRKWIILAMPLVPVMTVLCARKGERCWRLGMFLLVSGLSGFFVLLGYVPYSHTLVGALGPGYVAYAVPWAGAPMWVGCLLLFGGTLTLGFRPRHLSKSDDRWAID
ncbi:hypothetical protein LMG24238_06859 [Paraburkholderia sediminicola]|uniref:Uncharacterized protein n=1 Tax=Paraburkholderia sediminicola TaxID=458836 RepID=A0A6J5CRA8_9BURK|nr:hypothetical protein [Paraburkholderia sediminicola]CAB3742285.1 hypothetical protein LMG24238_06859 [Paraburkholderia sediminicola]